MSEYDIATKSTTWKTLSAQISNTDTMPLQGKVIAVEGSLIRALHIYAEIGTECLIGEKRIPCEIISVSKKECLLVCYKDSNTIAIDDIVYVKGIPAVLVGQHMLGRVLDGMGLPIDNQGPLAYDTEYALHRHSGALLERPLIAEQLYTNIKVLDVFTPLGRGQRIGVFSGSGVGKSTLIGMLARHSQADVNVICLVGERGREVKELIEYELGEEGMENTVVIVSTSEESAAMRLRSVFYACAISEYFSDRGAAVSLMVDSFTRVAFAQREIGMMRGELPVARGFPNSIYKVLPQIVERCGTSPNGSITGIFTVLVEGDDEDEPVSDIVRGIVDGHIILKRELAEQMQYPAIHISSSLSRVAQKIQKNTVYNAVRVIRERLGLYEQAKDIINAGVYTSGGNRRLDMFLVHKQKLDDFLRQGTSEKPDKEDTEAFILAFAEELGV